METDKEKPLVAKIGSAKTLERLADGIPGGSHQLLEALFPQVFKQDINGLRVDIPSRQNPKGPVKMTASYFVGEDQNRVTKEIVLTFGISEVVEDFSVNIQWSGNMGELARGLQAGDARITKAVAQYLTNDFIVIDVFAMQPMSMVLIIAFCAFEETPKNRKRVTRVARFIVS